MNSLFRKEIRLLFWPWVGAAFVVSVPVWIYSSQSALIWDRDAAGAISSTALLSYFCLAAAVLMLALTSFGYEFTAKTFSLFLSQPVSRQTLWRIKTIVLALGLLIVVGLHLLTLSLVLHSFAHGVLAATVSGELHDAVRVVPFITMIAWAGGLWTTLVFRNIAAALSATIIAPVVVLMFEGWIVPNIGRRYVDVLLPWTLAAYAVAAFAFAWWYFLRAQDVPWTGGTLSWSGRQNFVLRGFSAFRRSGKIAAFIRKELQLQQISFLIAGLILLCHLGSFALRLLGWVENSGRTAPSATAYLINNIWLLWLALPVLIGSSAVAEERRLGTLEALLTQPISRRVQLLIKVVLVFAAGALFGAIVPAQIEKLWNFVGPHNVLRSWMGLEGSLKISLGLTACALFASAISRHTIEAICLAVVLTPLAAAGLNYISSYGEPTAYIGIALVAAVSVWLLWRNYQRPQLRNADSALTWSALACSALLGWGGTSFTFNRGWEYFMRLEPRHGPAVYHLGDRAKIFPLGLGAIALLPDGRIWRAEDVVELRYEKLNDKITETHIARVEVTNAAFIAGTNWIDLAHGMKAFAIKSDGTLWCVGEFKSLAGNTAPRQHEQFLPPRQIGTDTNWASLCSGGWYVLALKRDGTLWGWGHNGNGELGPGPVAGFDEPKQIWSGTPWTNWTKVFASGSICYGFTEKYGIALTWGMHPQAQLGRIADYQPSPSPFPGTNWAAFHVIQYGFAPDYPRFAVGLGSNGTLWSLIHPNGNAPWTLPKTLFGQPVISKDGLQRLGDVSNWRAITTDGHLSALKQSGEWFVNSGHWVGRDKETNVRVSRYSDWLDIAGMPSLIGLAADGTVTCWIDLDSYPYQLAPTRRPAWSTNIFATAR